MTTDDDVSLDEIRSEVLAFFDGAPDGSGLDAVTAALVAFAVRACGTTLDLAGARQAMEAALDAGATPEQVQQTLVLIAGIGIHGMIGTAQVVHDVLAERGLAGFDHDMTDDERERFEAAGGMDARESRIAAVAPEFLRNVARLSPPETLEALLRFRAAPWASDALTPLRMELIGIAVDSMPSHRFLPTLRMHAGRARELGAGRREIVEVLDIAAAAPPHRGVR
jgi:alkylhydroperoxidase/carboxymuconolactone decarboxylase family protein YurZ